MKDAQDVELRKTYENLLVRKLGLGSNFPRQIIRSTVTEMGVGTVSPKTVISSLTLKLHRSHKRMKSENGTIIKIIENSALIEKGSKGGSSRHNDVKDSGPSLWIEGARKMLDERKAKIQI